MVTPLLLTSGPVRCGAVLHGGGTRLGLFYATVTVFQLYHGGDRMYEMRRRKPEPTLLQTQEIVNFLHHMV